MCLALALGMGLTLTTAGVSTAAPEAVPAQGTSLSPTSAAACPGEGERVKKTTEGRVYVYARGPAGSTLYWIPDAAVYNNLWGSWDGIITLPDAQFDLCYPNPSRHLYNGHLVKRSNGAVYIWDASMPRADGRLGIYRWIPNWDIFANKYHFDPAKIQAAPAVFHTNTPYWW